MGRGSVHVAENGLAPERNRKAAQAEFLTRHWDMLVAADFFTVEVCGASSCCSSLTWKPARWRLRTATQNFVEHYHTERNHQGLSNPIIRPEAGHLGATGAVQRRELLAAC
jgi:hypothetical protein